MAWHDDPTHPFAGIAEKLKRADQNIANLQAEINGFIKSGKYPVLPNQDDKAWQEAVTYHREKPIPLRFSVLAGEVVHHLRSCLDHIVWHFSSPEARLKQSGAIEFPLFEVKPNPTDKKEIERYKRKVQGITNAKVLSWIEQMQPYNAVDVADDSLLIIHNMDRFEKHRELVIVDCSAEITFPPDMVEFWRAAHLYTQDKLPAAAHPMLSRALKQYGKVTPGIAFRQFGKRETYAVVKGLVELWDEANTLAAIFSAET